MDVGPAPWKPVHQPFSVASVARARQDVRAEMLKDRLGRAVDALIECKTHGIDDVGVRQDVLFELYEDGILTRSEVGERGALAPEDFYDALHNFRQRRAQR